MLLRLQVNRRGNQGATAQGVRMGEVVEVGAGAVTGAAGMAETARAVQIVRGMTTRLRYCFPDARADGFFCDSGVPHGVVVVVQWAQRPNH